MIKYIFFDFDGTIVDSKGASFKAVTRVLEELGCEFSQNNLARLMGVKSEIFFKEIGLGFGQIDEAQRRFWKYFKKRTISDGEYKPCVSLKPLFDLAKNYKLVVISNSQTSYVKAILKKLKIKKLFKKIYGGEKFFTKDEFLKKLFRKFKIKPYEAIYVGDRFSDIDFARDAGCFAVAIYNKSSWSDSKTLKREKPDFIIRDFYGLKKVVGKLKKDNKIPTTIRPIARGIRP